VFFSSFSCHASFFKAYSSKVTSSEFSPFEENGKVGLKNTKGEILIPAEYEQLGWSDGSFSVIDQVTGYKLNNAWGIINLSNHKVTKPDYADLSPGQGSVLVARKKFNNTVSVRSGCITTTGKIVVPFVYDGISISAFKAIVYQKNGIHFRHGLIDLNSKTLIPLSYQAIYSLGSLRYAVVDFNKKTAIFTEEGKQLTDFLIDSISAFKKNYAVFYQDNHQGLINRDGQVLLQPQFRAISIDDSGGVRTKKADTWLIMKGNNEAIREIQADSIRAVDRGLYLIKMSGRAVLADNNFAYRTNLQYTSISTLKNGKAIVVLNGKKGIINTTGKVIMAPTFKDLLIDEEFVRASQVVGNTSRWLVFDSIGKSISTKTYEYIDRYNGEFFPVKNKGFWGALDKTGKEIIACVHDSLIDYSYGLIVVKFKGKYGVINEREDWLVTPQSYPIRLISSERYLLYSKPVFLKSIKGEVIYFTENAFEIKNNHLFEQLQDGTTLKITMSGVIADRFVHTSNIDMVFEESEGYRAIKKDGRYGFIDDRSRLRVANRYEDVKRFHEGLAPAKILGKWGYINQQDKIAIQPVYDEVGEFKNGVAIVKQKELYGVIDNSGKVILPIRYERIEQLNTGRLLVEQNHLIGLADNKGKLILNPKYNAVEDVGNDFIVVHRDGKSGVVTTHGLSTIPLHYDAIKFDHFHNQFFALKQSDWESVSF
jgi:hypothetical protein